MKRILRLAWPATLAALIVVVALGLSGSAGAASPSITTCPPGTTTLTCTSIPGDNVPVPYSNTVPNQPTYISFSASWQRGSDSNTLTHARVSYPVGAPGGCTITSTSCPDATFAGATIVSITAAEQTGSQSTAICGSDAVYRGPTDFPKEGVTCPLGSLPPNTTVTFTVVLKLPTQADAAGLTIASQAGLFVDESTNDSQPSSAHTDTFPTATVTNALTTDVSNIVNSFVPANSAGDFATSGGSPGTNGNFQKSEVAWGATSTTGFPGGGVAIQECGGPAGLTNSPACPTGTSNPCPSGVTCFSQTSLIIVPGSGGTYFTANPMTITLTFFKSELPAKFTLSQFVLYHDLKPVNSCKSKTLSDTTGDCISSLAQSKTTGDVTVVVVGPGNGGWGGAG